LQGAAQAGVVEVEVEVEAAVGVTVQDHLTGLMAIQGIL
jgi:hypothetical protein